MTSGDFNWESASLIYGSLDPSSTAVNAPAGWLYASTNGHLYIKQDAGLTNNWTNLSSSSGATFLTWHTDTGTYPVAVTSTDTMTLTSAGGTIGIAGNSSTDTIDFSLKDNAVTDAKVASAAAISVSKLQSIGNSFAVVTDGGGHITASATTATQIGYSSNVTSDIQTQINSKSTNVLTSGNLFVGSAGNVATSVTMSGDATIVASGALTIGAGAITDAKIASGTGIALSKLAALSASKAVASDGSGFLVASSTTSTQLGYLSTTTSDVQTQLNSMLLKSGGTMTGAIILAADPVNPLEPGTKQYIDALSSGLKWKTIVVASTTANLSATYLSGVLTEIGNGAFPSQDGVSISLNDRVLVQFQSTTLQNGIYTLTTVGSAGTPYVLTRSTDADGGSELDSACVTVASGTLYGGKAFRQTTLAPTIGTDPIVFVNFLNTTYTAGTGLTLTGATFSVTPNTYASIAVANTKAFIQGVTALSDGATITTDASLGNIFRVTIAGNRTMAAPTNPVDGQLINYEITQDGTGSRTITWNAAFVFSTDLPTPVLTQTASLTDEIMFKYISSSSKWRCMAVNRGYS